MDLSAPLINSKVKVIAKVVPLLPGNFASTTSNSISCITCIGGCDGSGEVTIQLKDPNSGRNEFYQFDSFYSQDNGINLIFEQEFEPLIHGVFLGSKASVFTYGANDSGKLFKLEGTGEVTGLMSLIMSKILSLSEVKKSVLNISYYEVYMEKCYDMLGEERKEISILDDIEGRIHLKGLHSVEIKSIAEFNNVLSQSLQRRKTALMAINEVPIRSHTVLAINVSTNHFDQTATLFGKLNIVDLAGNEDNKNAYKEGIHLRESAKINQSVLALSNVIHALNNDAPRVPYRDSKLTRILQDSLGGTSRSLMIACLNPANYQESVFTVRLAARSRKVPNSVTSLRDIGTPEVKVDMETKLKLWLESQGKTKKLQKMASRDSNVFSGSVKKKLKSHTSSASNFCTERKVINVNDRILLFEDDMKMKCPRDLKAESDCNPMKIHDNALYETLLKATKENLSEFRTTPVLHKKNDDRFAVRNILSPININFRQISTPLQSNSGNHNDKNTPLAKFCASSSKLKNSLVQEYIELLNAGTREELQELKGIGPKIADCILELREEIPIKSVKDLEKIGLSSKQISRIFRKNASSVFEI